jgi:hypothetical protein
MANRQIVSELEIGPQIVSFGKTTLATRNITKIDIDPDPKDFRSQAEVNENVRSLENKIKSNNDEYNKWMKEHRRRFWSSLIRRFFCLVGLVLFVAAFMIKNDGLIRYFRLPVGLAYLGLFYVIVWDGVVFFFGRKRRIDFFLDDLRKRLLLCIVLLPLGPLFGAIARIFLEGERPEPLLYEKWQYSRPWNVLVASSSGDVLTIPCQQDLDFAFRVQKRLREAMLGTDTARYHVDARVQYIYNMDIRIEVNRDVERLIAKLEASRAAERKELIACLEDVRKFATGGGVGREQAQSSFSRFLSKYREVIGAARDTMDLVEGLRRVFIGF